MSILQSFLLGALQGVTEFLPVSSSGHLRVAEHFFGLKVPILFDVILHVATLFAVLIFFRAEIARLFTIFFRIFFKSKKAFEREERFALSPDEKTGRQAILSVIITTAITALAGFIFKDAVKNVSVKITALFFLVTAVLLLFSSFMQNLTEKHYKMSSESREAGVGTRQALIIGIFQSLAILPGLSRSGATISGAVLSNVRKEAATVYSFIISIPVILGAFLLEIKDFGELREGVDILALTVGFFTAFFVGLLSLKILMRIIKNARLFCFAFYLVPLSAAILIFM